MRLGLRLHAPDARVQGLTRWVFRGVTINLRIMMITFSVSVIAVFLLISWLVCLEVYRGTEQGLRHRPRSPRHREGL